MKRSLPQPGHREVGAVEQYEKGFGFIISQNPPEGEPSKIFVYHKEIVAEGFRSLKPGMVVSFERSFDTQTQKPCCKDVRNTDGTPINIEETRKPAAKPKEKRQWRNVFQAIPAFRLESYTECSPVATTQDAALEDEDIPYIGSCFGLFRGRFGDEMSKFLRDKLPIYFRQAISDEETDICEALGSSFELAEKDFMEKTLPRRSVDGCEAVCCLFQHTLKNGKACVKLYVANVGTCQLILCSQSGKATSLSAPHTATAAAIKNQGVEYDPDQGAAVAGFVDDGIEYRLKSSRVLGARPFKTPKCTLSSAADVLEGKEWQFKMQDDLFALLVAPEIVEWHGGPQACVNEALDAMRTAQDTGENLTEFAAKQLVRRALRKGAPEELSCQCISFTWMAKILDKLLDQRKQQKLEGTTEKPVEDDGFDMFAM